MDIAEYEKQEKERIEKNIGYAEKGVKFIDIKSVYIDGDAKIGAGTVIYPAVVLEGDVEIGENCTIGTNSRIRNSKIGSGTNVWSSVVLDSTVGEDTQLGPFAYIRPNSHIGNGCRVGDFVEVKNSTFGDGSKSSHLTYIGDSDIGERVNLGCGVVFVNYDGSKKYRSTVSDDAFIGCNSNMISPVSVGKKAYIAAGSTVTKNVPDGSLYIERAKPAILEGWVERSGKLDKSKK